MQKRKILGIAACFVFNVCSGISGAVPSPSEEAARPNVIIILTDDQGYGDLSTYGSTRVRTPRIDRMAEEGTKLTNFYVGAPVCSASRASLLTGCYPQRLSIPGVVSPGTGIGLNPEETTIAEMLHEAGYATGLIGKWHLGYEERFFPTRQGFDEFFGSPYSIGAGMRAGEGGSWPRAGWPLYEGESMLEMDPDKGLLTQRYTQRAVQFIERNKDHRFFLYLAHHMPHTPLQVSKEFKGKGGSGTYSDVIAELDWSTGEILDALARCGVDEQTIVIFLSDNGPWLIFGDHGGSAGVLRGGKKQNFEGGMRVPCIVRWPGAIPPGTIIDSVVTSMDVFPTLATLCGGKLPPRRIDGEDISTVLLKNSATGSHRAPFYYYWESELRGIRDGKWKLQFAHSDHEAPDPAKIGTGGVRGEVMTIDWPLALYDLSRDPTESKDLSKLHPEIVDRLSSLAETARADLGDSIQQRTGTGVRPCGRIEK